MPFDILACITYNVYWIRSVATNKLDVAKREHSVNTFSSYSAASETIKHRTQSSLRALQPTQNAHTFFHTIAMPGFIGLDADSVSDKHHI